MLNPGLDSILYGFFFLFKFEFGSDLGLIHTCETGLIHGTVSVHSGVWKNTPQGISLPFEFAQKETE